MTDYALLPPEINSARLYAGPGSTPMLMAAAAWDDLSTSLSCTAAQCGSVIGDLSATWLGPSATAMATAAARYTTWLTRTAAQAEQIAAQARTAACAYETALAAIVPPATVATNRLQLAALVATNIFGQNSAAIAATEAQYAQMWAQDVATMYAYEASSRAALSATAPFTPPPVVSSVLNPNHVPVFGLDSGSLLGYYLGDFIQSGFFFDVPLQLLGLFTVLWGISPASPLVQTILNNPAQVATPVVLPPPLPAPTPAAAVPNINVRVGAGDRVGLLRVPPSWAQAKTSPPLPGGVPLAVAEDTITLPAPVPIPLGAARGTPTKQPRPEPQFGTPMTFMTRPPSGG